MILLLVIKDINVQGHGLQSQQLLSWAVLN